MTVERALRGLAGFFVLLSLALARLHSEYWLLFTAFVGLNLLQSFFTGWRPATAVLKACGVGQERTNAPPGASNPRPAP